MDIKRKLSSRKMWAAIVGVISGLAVVFGLDGDTITAVSGAVISGASIIAYISGEAKVDAAREGNKTTVVEEVKVGGSY